VWWTRGSAPACEVARCGGRGGVRVGSEGYHCGGREGLRCGPEEEGSFAI
jgi:hypothetical protein